MSKPVTARSCLLLLLFWAFATACVGILFVGYLR